MNSYLLDLYLPNGLLTAVESSDFKGKYWPKFDHRLTRRLDPGLVFSEILGVIKGCGENLSKEEYLYGLSYKKSPLLLGARSEIYGIFESYLRKCQRWKEYDTADRCDLTNMLEVVLIQKALFWFRTRRILQEYSQSPKWQVDHM